MNGYRRLKRVMDGVEELVIIGCVIGMALVLTIVLLIYCYKKGVHKKGVRKASDKDNTANARVEPSQMEILKKRPSDLFTIPRIQMDAPVLTTLHENVTEEEIMSPVQEQHYPPFSPMLVPSYDQTRLKRSVSCPSGPGRETNTLGGANLNSGPSKYGSEGSLVDQTANGMSRKLETKSTRGQLALPDNEGRKISVYSNMIMDVGQTTLARRRATLLTQTESYKKAGMIHFSTEYLEEAQIFQVHVHRVTDLTKKNVAAQINPFARLYLSPGKKHKQDTKVFQDTKDPTFDEMLEFQTVEKEDLTERKLKIKLYSQERIKRKELLGQVDILISSLSLCGKETFDIYLFKQRSTISMTSVSIALCHQATNSRLEVFIDQLKKVPKGGVSTSIYGALTLYKGDMSISRNTTIKYHTKDPIFEEMLTFQDLSTDSSMPLSSLTLVFSLVERNLIGQDQILGHVIFNTGSPQSSAAKQWTAVQSAPHTNHTSWHYLVDPDELKR